MPDGPRSPTHAGLAAVADQFGWRRGDEGLQTDSTSFDAHATPHRAGGSTDKPEEPEHCEHGADVERAGGLGENDLPDDGADPTDTH